MTRAQEEMAEQEETLRDRLFGQLQTVAASADEATTADTSSTEALQSVVTSLRNTHEKQVVARELFEVRSAERLESIAGGAHRRLTVSQEELEGAGEEVLDSIDTRFAGLEVAVAGGLCEKELQQCLNQTEERLTTIERRMPAHNDDLRKRTTEFELATERELKQMEHQVEEEVEAGQQLAEKVRQMVEDVKCRMRRAVHLERVAREKSEESFLQTIEAACPSAERST
eukprot:CAMPEP_0177769698 /NCGR_PEP_ID=MMETSP0491_2-20121128/10489_1 /TAXON_ID=63592 /ORGANISM="Tetraselmis chuii, Strain PLY429" /LENGTH=227 /DNA_ID=CAMNT_0019286781 /DNA_START=267 /DNA_END=950 /DNA_ORIENTATION=+